MSELTGEYRPMNAIQRKLLRRLKPWTDRPDFFKDGVVDVDLRGFSKGAVFPLMRELESAGYLKILAATGISKPKMFVLRSAARRYDKMLAWHVAKTFALGALNIVSGCAGGLVVWLLTRALG